MASEAAGEKSALSPGEKSFRSLSNPCHFSGVFSTGLSDSTDKLSLASSLRNLTGFSGVFSAAVSAVAELGVFAGFLLALFAESDAAGLFMAMAEAGVFAESDAADLFTAMAEAGGWSSDGCGRLPWSREMFGPSTKTYGSLVEITAKLPQRQW